MVFSLLATILAAIGVFSALSAFVAARTHEFGVRTALGASPAAIRGIVLGTGARLAAVGLLIGVATVMGLSSVVSSLFYDMNPLDPGILSGVGAALVLTTLLSGCYPAIRAGQRNPVDSIQSE